MTRGTKLETVKSLLGRTKEDENGCMVWQGFMQNGTVPMVAHGGKMVAVRKIIGEELGKHARTAGYWSTKCGNPSCVNPEHITKMTRSTFAVHMCRQLTSNPTKMALRNAKLAKVRRKLTDEQLQEIMHSNESNRALAKKFDVSQNTINKHRRGRMGVTLDRNPWLQLLTLGDKR